MLSLTKLGRIAGFTLVMLVHAMADGDIQFGSNTVMDELKFRSVFNWNWSSGAEGPASNGPLGDTGPEWNVWNVRATAANAQGEKTLRFSQGHRQPPEDPPHGEGRGTTFTKSLLLSRPAQGDIKRTVRALQISHGGHFDLYTWGVALETTVAAEPVTSGSITYRGIHRGPALPFNYSYTPLTKSGSLNIFATYSDGTEQAVFSGMVETAADDQPPPPPPPPADPNDQDGDGVPRRVSGRLPPHSVSNLEPTDYRMNFTGSGTTDTELLFIGETETGEFEKMQLSLATELFVGLNEFLVPMLFDTDETQDLFVAVDLVQWLSLGTPFDGTTEYSLSDGTSELLPGFLVSTSEITFDSNVGFVTSDPLTDQVKVVGAIDGKVPAPSVVSLLLLAGVATGVRRERATA